MILVVDVGNTRVKWAACEQGQLSAQQAAEHSRWDAGGWERALFADSRIDRVVVVSVAGNDSKRALVDAAARRGIGDVTFVASSASACGVRNAYRDPSLLGVDRWAAVIGAHHLFGARACCVVDVGTATTIDAVDASGRHLGGFIVPGPSLMVRSLHAGTSDLAAHSAASPTSATAFFADNTRDAIERGCRVTLAALVDRSHAELERATGKPALVVITGGAAAQVRPYVLAPLEFVPDLVLNGAARLAWIGS